MTNQVNGQDDRFQAGVMMNDSQLPSPLNTQLLVNVQGAKIISSNSDDPSVLLPHHEESE
jgi:hypothetical protein